MHRAGARELKPNSLFEREELGRKEEYFMVVAKCPVQKALWTFVCMYYDLCQGGFTAICEKVVC